MCPCKLKSEEEKLKHVGLAQQKWFWASIFAHFAEAGKENCKRGALRLVKRTAREECREYDRPLSDCPILMTGTGALLLVQSSFSPVCSSTSFSCMGGVGNK